MASAYAKMRELLHRQQLQALRLHNEGWTGLRLAKKFGVSKQAISMWLRNHGVPPRQLGRPAASLDAMAVVREFSNGTNCTAIARKMHTSVYRISRILKSELGRIPSGPRPKPLDAGEVLAFYETHTIPQTRDHFRVDTRRIWEILRDHGVLRRPGPR